MHIIIGTYGKSGTTWVQQIVSQLLFDGAEGLEVAAMSPWLDLCVPPKHVKLEAVEAQTHRRFLKTHLPVDALAFSPAAKYIYIGREGRDVIWSMYNHHANANERWYQALNDSPGRVGPPIDKPPSVVADMVGPWLWLGLWPWLGLWRWRGYGWGPGVGIYIGPGYGRRCWSPAYGYYPCGYRYGY